MGSSKYLTFFAQPYPSYHGATTASRRKQICGEKAVNSSDDHVHSCGCCMLIGCATTDDTATDLAMTSLYSIVIPRAVALIV